MNFFLSNSTNDSNLWRVSHNSTDLLNSAGTLNLPLFCLICFMSIAALGGSIFSLVSLLKLQNKTAVSTLVASWSVDDLMSVLSVAIFLVLQWPEVAPGYFGSLCTTSGLLYLCQGLSSNLKATLLMSDNFRALRGAAQGLAGWGWGWGGGGGSGSGPGGGGGGALGAALAVWAASLLLAALPLGGWAAFVRTPWGCLADRASAYVLLPCGVYAAAFALLAGLSAPLAPRLLCSDEPPRPHAHYQQLSRGASSPGTPSAAGRALSPSPEEAPRRAGEGLPSPDTRLGPGPPAAAARGTRTACPRFSGSLAQRRFAFVLALTKAALWLPMMIHTVVQHVVGFQSVPVDTLSFLLTLLATIVTPVFVLSKHWTHFPCGCIINCRPDACSITSDGGKPKRKGFEFNLSFQQSYGIYKIAHSDYSNDYHDENSMSYPNLKTYECETTKEPQRNNHNIFNTIKVEISTTPFVDSATGTGINKCTNTDTTEVGQDPDKENGAISDKTGSDINYIETTIFEGAERRLSQEENQKLDLTDWEWCRSKSERNPRQRPGGGLAIPLCAFQGTVSLQAPTGKTLSLSTYEVSTEGQKITPASKKIEVYRSKSVGHEPNSEDSPSTFADTNVKIHLEVLEICDNDEALDTVSIISNISQSSTQVRSPSLRYSRKENRFVSCDLGETASYSLFLPTSNPDGEINISIPDTVEAHRQNSKRQHQERDSYQEEIQLLNTAYRKREEESKET
uniref:probable G-protein coupled receptor 149 n=1 Tax=Jaculus jaculus TaxID=51337 RepID=UPI001E1B2559|nr:probable G-protein coupled receptor 149 [Jaculus jaculus]